MACLLLAMNRVSILFYEGTWIMLGTILLVVLILMLVGAFPAWPHSRNWGPYPSGGLGLVLLILVILILLGRVPIGF